MKISELFLPTLRETPQDAEILSYKLMLKAGIIRKIASGIYSYLPLGLRSLQKIEQIIREEMNDAGAQEILFPAILPKEIWDETGRWELYGEEMFKLRDRKGREFCLGPTHEEAVVDLVRGEIRSYKELPKTFYQIQTKYRDEIRPRFGVMRAREFIMKDAYSFDISEAELENTYNKIFNAYVKIFERCGLSAIPIEADSGAIGGKVSHEFVVKSTSAGESTFVSCPHCDYAASIDAAKSKEEDLLSNEQEKPLEEIATPNVKSVEEIAKFLHIDKTNIAKSLLYKIDDKFVLALVRGDDELNEIKLKNLFNANHIRQATEEEVKKLTGASIGSIGPVKTKLKIVIDRRVSAMKNFTTGANKDGFHFKNVNTGRDFSKENVADIRKVKEGDLCPKCGTPLTVHEGVEVGHTFKLGTKYSEKMDAKFLDSDGKEKHFVMGCYGIGVGRTLAAIIEEYNDKYGIKWPVSVAPFTVEIIPLNMSDSKIKNEAEKLYKLFKEKNIETIIDDRDNVSAGVKFNDADLIGMPFQVIVGRTFKQNSKIEIKKRETGEKLIVEEQNVITFIEDTIKD